ncbi:hypothetical protein NE237_009806 [Protea cynaroides]|uniref:Protein kinase domain-containing protein n=1 Tax=Protea cynaroides TaxID=273540 RepID=A0A9Q0KZB5_9MAGN|nr:hypothetical protein NE237_009806 [Protea cynaroides]
MGSLWLLDIFLSLLIHICLPATSALSMAQPGCNDTCGNISVPYPFGMGNTNCYRDSGFQVICNDTFYDPPKLFNMANQEILDISLQGQQRILNYVSRDCYNSQGDSTCENRREYDYLYNNTFTISDTENKFTVLGCDTEAYFSTNGTVSKSGCIMSCLNEQISINGSCDGIGCCQTSIPKGFGYISIAVSSNNNHTLVHDFNPCGYAFIVDYNWYNFSTSDILNFTHNIDETGYPRVPVVVDWAIAWEKSNSSCKEAMKNQTSYACGSNSVCNDSKNGLGYICSCSQGYHGNPNLQDGCQDIDECTDPNYNYCPGSCSCVNLLGTYNCFYPHDYRRDNLCSIDPIPVKTVNVAFFIGGGLVLSSLLFGCLWLFKVLKKRKKNKLKKKFFQENGGFLLQQQISSENGNIEKTKLFSDEELKKATDNYNENRILGQGGQGTVYKGMLLDGRIVAIKKSKGVHDQGQIEQFINEIALLSQINHRNVVKLFGCCLETEVPMLVYEFISNGTLFSHIHGNSTGEFSFTWDSRLRIAIEVAQALAYLHSAASIPIYHRDIKSSNILLDDRFIAKVSDFGISRSVSTDKTHLTVTLVQGTFGYLDPEYFQSSQFTDKSDVYSFAVVLLELLTGRKPISSTRSEEKSLVTEFICSMDENRLFEILDAQVVEEVKKEELEAIAIIAKRCLDMNGKKRPTMREVAAKLEGLRASPSETLFVQRNEEHEDCIITESIGLWDTSSVSTTSCTTSWTSVAIPLDDRPLLHNSSSQIIDS